ncbi:MAG: NACHT domain-containing protein [Alphaproteobacteria bacterium]|nr:NACHT domain-containing protein [Alphaproteobacteria bacterium]
MAWFFAIVSILLLILLAFVTKAYLDQRKYRRERFAFFAVSSMLSGLVVLVGTLASVPWWVVFFEPFGFAATQYSIDTITKISFVLIYGVFVYAITQIHKYWDGPVHIARQDAEKFFGEKSIFIDARFFFGQAFLDRSNKSDELNKAEQEAAEFSKSISKKKTPYHELVRTIIEMKYKQWRFSIDDWHDAGKTWIGKDKKLGFNVAVVLADDKKQVEHGINYLKNWQTAKKEKIEGAIVIGRKNTPENCEKISEFTVEKMAFDMILEDLLDWSDYEDHIMARYEQERLPNTDITLSHCYTPLRVAVEGKNEEDDLDRHLDHWLNTTDDRHIALLGEYGQGKSSAALHFCWRLMKDRKRFDRVPLLIELRGQSPKSSSDPGKILASWGHSFRLDSQGLMLLHEAGKLILVFDGFDEMDNIGTKKERADHFFALWRFVHNNSKILITGRPNLFLDDHEMRRNLGVQKGPAIGSHYEIASIQMFSFSEIRYALRHQSQEMIEEIILLAQNDKNFRDAVSRPSLLQQLSVIWYSPSIQQNKTNVSSAKIIREFLRTTFERQARKLIENEEELGFMALNRAEIDFFTRGIAAQMLIENKPNQINKDSMDRTIQKLIRLLPNDHRFERDVAPYENREALLQRLKKVDNIAEEISTNVRTYGVIVRDWSSTDTFKFSHKSFYELLGSELLFDWLEKPRTVEAGTLRRFFRNENFIRYTNQEMIDFLAEMLSEQSYNENFNANNIFNQILKKVFSPAETFALRYIVAFPAVVYQLLVSPLKIPRKQKENSWNIRKQLAVDNIVFFIIGFTIAVAMYFATLYIYGRAPYPLNSEHFSDLSMPVLFLPVMIVLYITSMFFLPYFIWQKYFFAAIASRTRLAARLLHYLFENRNPEEISGRFNKQVYNILSSYF